MSRQSCEMSGQSFDCHLTLFFVFVATQFCLLRQTSVALGFCRDNAIIMSQHNCISYLSHFYFYFDFLVGFVSFALKA